MSGPPQSSPSEPTDAPGSQGNARAAEPPGRPPFHRRHAKAINAVFVALCFYVALIWLMALDQKFHWGLFSRPPSSPP